MSSRTTLGTPIVGLSALIVGATLGQTLHRLATTSAFCAKYCCQSCTAAADDVSTGDDDKSGAVSSDGDRSSKRDQEKGVAPITATAMGGFGFAATNGGGGGGGGGGGDDVVGGKNGKDDESAIASSALDNSWNDSSGSGSGSGAAADGAAVVKESDADDDKLPSFWIITLFVLTRIVICPAVCCALVWGVGDRVITSSDPADAQLIKLVLILEAIVPSADFVIVS